jgi:uncharacterized protein
VVCLKSESAKDFVFVETKNMNLKGYTLIEGFPDLGLAGTIGARYIIEKMKFEQIGFVDSNLFMPITRIDNGVPLHPVRIYADKKSKIAIIISEQIIDNKMAPQMAKELLEWIKKKGIVRVISTSGVRMPEGKSVYAFASDEKSKKLIKENKIEMIMEGVTSGVTALLMLYLKDNKIEAFCILGNAKNNADYNAAAEVVKTIALITKIKVDVAPLFEEGKKLEAAISSHLKTMEEQQTKETKVDSSQTPMYT